eukprot:g16636.t1
MESTGPPSPARLEVGSLEDGADLFEFSERAAVAVLNYLCVLIVEADRATRSLGEQRMKEIITDGIGAVRHALDDVSRHLPQDEHMQREYARRFLEATRDGGDAISTHSPERCHGQLPLVFDTAMAHNPEDDDDNGTRDGIEGHVSPQQMLRVGNEFGALQLPYTEQDIVSALGWVRTMISDVQNVLLELDDRDLDELAQITLISLRILVGYAKSTHRSLAQLCRVPYQHQPTAPRSMSISAPGGGLNNVDAHTNGGAASSSSASSPSPSPSSTVAPSLFQIDDVDGIDDQDGQDAGGVLPWDPLAPRLLEMAQRLAKEGKDHPFTAAVVLAAALPFSGAAVFFGAPVLVGDAALQWGAGTPVGRTVGQGTKNAVELGKLGWVASKLATKQTLRLATQELNRLGGLTGLACQVGEGAVWTARHPIDAAMVTVGVAADTGKAVYERALWVGDLLAAFGEEMFAGPADAGDCGGSNDNSSG